MEIRRVTEIRCGDDESGDKESSGYDESGDNESSVASSPTDFEKTKDCGRASSRERLNEGGFHSWRSLMQLKERENVQDCIGEWEEESVEQR